MEHKEKPAEEESVDSKGTDPGALGILLNAPSTVSRLVGTALLLSMFTGILYLWGASYYGGFIHGLGLDNLNFAFHVPANEVLVGGTTVIFYYVAGLPLAYLSVGVLLMVVIVLAGLTELILVPTLASLARSLKPLLARLWGLTGARLFNLKPFRWLRKILMLLKPKKPAGAEYERALKWLVGSVELYIAHALVVAFLLVLFLWGLDKSRKLGLEDAHTQLKSSPQVHIMYGDNEKIESTLCARIGDDYVLKSQDPNVKYEIVKESTIKRIAIMQPTPQKNP